jgi:hypothetical protein
VRKKEEKTEPVHAIPGSDTWPKWLLEYLDTRPRLDEVIQIQKKDPKRIEDRGELEKIIVELFRAIEELKSGRPVSHATFEHATELAESWYSEFGKSRNLLVVMLAGLVVAQKRMIESFDKLRQFFDLSRPLPEHKLSAKQRYDIRRRHAPVVGNIEWEFGGVRPPGVTDNNESLIHRHKPPEPPTCLDDIFTGHAVSMQDLVSLFGRDRHLLAKYVGPRIKKGRETLYDYRTVTDITNALLSEPKKRKTSTRRRPPREPWLSDPPPGPDWRPVIALWHVRHYCRQVRRSVREPLRTRVLTGIEARIDSLSERVPREIKSAFLAVIHRHLIRVEK